MAVPNGTLPMITATTSEVRRDVRISAVVGVVGFLSYVALAAAPLPDAAAATLAALFGPGVMILSWGLRSLLRVDRRSVSADLAFVSNTAAGVLITAMLLVQIAAGPHASEGAEVPTKSVWLGLDVAWDVYLVLGTLFFAWSMIGHPRFGWALAAPGFVIAAALLVLNLATFPKPPVSVGLPDLGPVIGVYYMAVAIAMWLSWDWLGRTQPKGESAR